MGFYEQAAKRHRLKHSKVVELLEGELKVRVAECDGLNSFALSGDVDSSKKATGLLLGCCITENGEPLFRTENDVADFRRRVPMSEVMRLVNEAIQLVSAANASQGNSEGSPSAS